MGVDLTVHARSHGRQPITGADGIGRISRHVGPTAGLADGTRPVDHPAAPPAYAVRQIDGSPIASDNDPIVEVIQVVGQFKNIDKKETIFATVSYTHLTLPTNREV